MVTSLVNPLTFSILHSVAVKIFTNSSNRLKYNSKYGLVYCFLWIKYCPIEFLVFLSRTHDHAAQKYYFLFILNHQCPVGKSL